MQNIQESPDDIVTETWERKTSSNELKYNKAHYKLENMLSDCDKWKVYQ